MAKNVLSSFNGWDSHPEEIEQSSFVQCSIERVIERNEFTAWLKDFRCMDD